ncbi:CarD family transcriptional regulator [Alkalihalobacterium elongatum]|uniref:CarD family transcriptional regulator n=1 Tax=Alkalihalobacterium elongatum TaxID=2675466 RepID=UPI001C1F8331|nr:CarD family transcriptional regulator [Alkalihalobacterium elongatum]
MFQVGDEIVYPPYGAGYVIAIEEKSIQDEKEKFYVFDLLLNELNVALPFRLVSKRNVRSVMSFGDLNDIFGNLVNANSKVSLFPLHKKLKQYENVLIKGDMESIAVIMQALVRKKIKSSLNSTERELYNKFHNMVVSEIMISKNILLDEAEALLYQMCEDE